MPKTPNAGTAIVTRSLLNRVADWALLIVAFYATYRAFYEPPESFYSMIDISPSAPNFQVRNAFVDYCATRRGMEDGFETPSSEYPFLGRKRKWTDSDDDASDEEAGVSEYDFYSGLFELIKLDAHKRMYLTFGHKTFVGCSWCNEREDYAAYYVAAMAQDYLGWVVTLVFLHSIASKGTRRDGWITWMIIYFLGLASTELSSLLTPSEMWAELGGPSNAGFDLHTWVISGRRLTIAGVFCFMWIMSQRAAAKSGTKHHLIQLIQRQKELLENVKALQLQQLAVMDDDQLLDHFSQHHRHKQQGRHKLMQDPELQDVRAQLMQKREMEMFIKNAEAYSSLLLDQLNNNDTK